MSLGTTKLFPMGSLFNDRNPSKYGVTMTAKEAIKAKCKDCNEKKEGNCKFPECPLFGLRNSVGGCNRPKAIKEYCLWCRHGLSTSVCSSPECPIYKYLELNVKDDEL